MWIFKHMTLSSEINIVHAMSLCVIFMYALYGNGKESMISVSTHLAVKAKALLSYNCPSRLVDEYLMEF